MNAGVHINRQPVTDALPAATPAPRARWRARAPDITAEALCRELIKTSILWQRRRCDAIGRGAAAADDAIMLLQLLQAQRVHTTVDTCGMLFTEQLERALLHTDLVLTASSSWTMPRNAA